MFAARNQTCSTRLYRGATRVASLFQTLMCLFVAIGANRAHATSVPATQEPVAALIIGFNRFLVLPGTTHTDGQNRDLRFADNDAARFAEIWRQFHPGQPFILLIEPDEILAARLQQQGIPWRLPTDAELSKAVDELRGTFEDPVNERPRGRVLFFFSGHGESEGTLHFGERGLTNTSLVKHLQRIGSKEVLALIDACHGFAAAKGGGAGNKPRSVVIKPPIPGRSAWMGVIGSNLQILEYSDFGGGALTQTTIACLRGLADGDGDKRILFRDLGICMQSQLGASIGVQFRESAAMPLQPVVNLDVLSPSGVIFDRSAKAGLWQIRRHSPSVPRSAALSSLEGGSTVVAEFYLQGRTRLTLRLEPGDYRIARFADSETWRGARPGSESGPLSVRITDVKVPPGALILVTEGRMRDGNVSFPMKGGEEETDIHDTIALTTEEYDRLGSVIFREAPPPLYKMLPDASGVRVMVHDPTGGAVLSEDSAGSPGLTLQVGWALPVAKFRPFLLDAGLSAGYSLSHQTHIYCGGGLENPCFVPTANWHRLLVGPTVALRMTVPRGQVRLEGALAYAPGLVTRDLAVVQDLDHDPTAPFWNWRYVFTGDMAASISASSTFRVGPYVELGPSLQLRASLFNPLNPAPYSLQAVAGIELRPTRDR